MKALRFWLIPAVAVGLLIPWLVCPTGNVTVDHVIHWPVVNQWVRTWHEGGWWPVYLQDVNAGLGSFWPLYYPPLYHASCALLVCSGLSYWHAGWAVVALATGVGALLCYGWLRRHAPPRAAFWGALAYCLAPHPFLEVYHRGGLPEAIAFQMLPGVLWACDLLRKEWRWSAVFLGGLTFAVIVLSNLAATVVALYATALYLAGGAVAQKRLGPFLRGLAVPLAGFALTAFFWVPAWVDKSQVTLPWTHILSLPQSAPFVRLGVLGNAPVLEMCVFFLLWATLLLAVLAAWSLHRAQIASWARGLLLGIVGIVLSLEGTAWLYRLLPVLWRIQFPSRCLGMVAPGMALLAAQASFAWRRKPWGAFGLAALWMAYLALFWGQFKLVLTDNLPTHGQRVNVYYVPLTARLPTEDQPILPAVVPTPGTVHFQVVSWQSGYRAIATQAHEPFSLVLCVYADARWKAYNQDHRPLVTKVKPEERWGRLEVEAPAGTSLVTLQLEPTWSAYLGTAITTATLAAFLVVTWHLWRKRRPSLSWPPTRPSKRNSHSEKSRP
jgi:hypothetical protein